MAKHPPITDNIGLANHLLRFAEILRIQNAGPFRVQAYERAAGILASHPKPVAKLLASGGRPALEALPGIGRAIAGALIEMITTGRWAQLDRLEGGGDPVQMFRRIPGIGPALAKRIHEDLHLETLDDLEVAALDGRLERLDGVGARRLAMVRSALATRSTPRSRRPTTAIQALPPVPLLLAIDAEYRRRAKEGTLPTISPRNRNPGGRPWLPILHISRDGWDFTALFSNSARAHAFGRVGDWVIIAFQADDLPENVCTVVTARQGRLAGQRVVRGREEESAVDVRPSALMRIPAPTGEREEEGAAWPSPCSTRGESP